MKKLKDFPLFNTKNGIASLKFKEIPYNGTAYITLGDSRDPEAMLGDCIDFCKAVGAEKIYASGSKHLENYPLHTHVLKLRIPKAQIGETDAVLVPVTEDDLPQFREFYNQKMRNVPNASYMDINDAKLFLEEKCCYNVERDGRFLGIAIGSGAFVYAIAANQPGAGRTILQALCSVLTGEHVVLEVASANEKALALYRRMGFVQTDVLSSWYKII